MKIVSLEVENLMRISAARIEPDGSLVIVGGDNDQGKTSLLNAIEYALAGKRSVAGKPVREGADKARIVLDLEDLKVTRTFTASGGGTLVVRGADGEKISSPQQLLNRLFSKLTFNPLAFLNLNKEKQASLLLELIGVDLSKIDNEKEQLSGQRRDAGAALKNAQGAYDDAKSRFIGLAEQAGMEPGEVPEERILIDEVRVKLEQAKQVNHVNSATRSRYQSLRALYSDEAENEQTVLKDIEDLESQILAKKEELESVRDEKKKLSREGVQMRRDIEQLKDVDESAIVLEFQSIAGVNEAVAAKQVVKENASRLNGFKDRYRELDDQVKALPVRKQKLIGMARMPIEGLGYEDGVVTYDGTPFDQVGTGTQIRVSVAMGVAMNPELRVFLVRRDGSLLDDKNLELLGELADEYKAQVWMERVSKGQECQVIIEDGTVLELAS